MNVAYDAYNREERALCAHLFRLLHEGLATRPAEGPLARVLGRLAERDLQWRGAGLPLPRPLPIGRTIFTEVALIRDAYQDRKRSGALSAFMDELVAIVKRQQRAEDCPLWSELPRELSDPAKVHPRQILLRAQADGFDLGRDFARVYGAVQGLFNAKPDLVVTTPEHLLVFEAKLTQAFERDQLERTAHLAELWSSPLLRGDLGFEREPSWSVIQLGDARANPELSWQELAGFAVETWPANDRSRIAFEAAVRLLAPRSRR